MIYIYIGRLMCSQRIEILIFFYCCYHNNLLIFAQNVLNYD